MLSKRLIVIYFVLGVTSLHIVAGLQCYVCEDCNEYEDFKELHICGEIGMTIKPVTLPEILENNQTVTTLKPAAEEEEYVDFYSEETHDGNNSSSDKKKEENGSSSLDNSEEHKEIIETITATTTTQNPTTTNLSTKKKRRTTTRSALEQPTTVKQTETPSNSSSDIPTSTSFSNIPTSPTPETSSVSSNPIQLPDDNDDYLEYDIPSDDRRQVKTKSKFSPTSLLRIDEPVCYITKFHVNNTIITNRGCTTFVNANKQLTCQSLNNGASMEKCLICSNDGCNKFLSDYSYEDNGDFPNSASGIMKKLGVLVLLILAMMNLIVG